MYYDMKYERKNSQLIFKMRNLNDTALVFQGVYLLKKLDENTASVSYGVLVHLLIRLDENTASVSYGVLVHLLINLDENTASVS